MGRNYTRSAALAFKTARNLAVKGKGERVNSNERKIGRGVGKSQQHPHGLSRRKMVIATS
jgi:hypothetical protein